MGSCWHSCSSETSAEVCTNTLMQSQMLRCAGHRQSLGRVLTALGSVGWDPTPDAWPSSHFLKPILVVACSRGMRCSQGLSWASGDGEADRVCVPALLETPTRVSSVEKGRPGRPHPPVGRRHRNPGRGSEPHSALPATAKCLLRPASWASAQGQGAGTPGTS